MEAKAFVCLFTTPGGHYLLDVNRNSILTVEKEVYGFLSCQFTGREKISLSPVEESRAREWVERRKAEGYLSDRRVSEILHPADDVLIYLLKNQLRMITLQLTQNCNLRCDYCPYSGGYHHRGHSSRRMDFETARKGIDFLIRHSRDSRRIAIGFYGGEPLLEFAMMRQCIGYAKEQAAGKPLSFNFTTNGTLLTEEIMAYLAEHQVAMMISLDGPREIHDRKRKDLQGRGTFDIIMRNIRMIRRQFPAYLPKISFNVVLDPDREFRCTDVFFAENEITQDILLNVSGMNPNYLKDEKSGSNPDENFTVSRGYEKFKVMLAKLGQMSPEYTSKIVSSSMDHWEVTLRGSLKPRLSLPERTHHGGPCIPGERRLFMDVEGNFFPCERVSEISAMMKIGHVDRGFDLERVRAILNIGKLSEEACKNCWALLYCRQCAACVDELDSFGVEKKGIECRKTREMVMNDLKDYCALREFGYKPG